MVVKSTGIPPKCPKHSGLGIAVFIKNPSNIQGFAMIFSFFTTELDDSSFATFQKKHGVQKKDKVKVLIGVLRGWWW